MESEESLQEQIKVLDGTVAEQREQIAALMEVVADLIAAHCAVNADKRLVGILGDTFQHWRRQYETGGTVHTSAKSIGDKCGSLGEILEKAYSSSVFDRYWSSSVRWKKEETQRQELDQIRNLIDKVLNQ